MPNFFCMNRLVRLRFLFIVATLFLPCLPALAENEAVHCNPSGNQAEMDVCAAQDLNRSDAEMNQLYKESMSPLEPDAQKELRDVQRAWIVFRDKECAYEVGPPENGGSIWPLEKNECLKDLTDQRIQTLKKMSGKSP